MKKKAPKKGPRLEHVFRVSVLSARNDGSWVERHVERVDTCFTPFETAGQVAARNMKVVEKGVKVEYVGLAAEGQPFLPPPVILGAFSLILIRHSAWYFIHEFWHESTNDPNCWICQERMKEDKP